MQIETVPIDSVHQDPNNARTHNARNIDAIVASIVKFGQVHPIIVGRDDIILAGNGRHEAMKKIGRTEIDIIRTDMDGYEAAAFAIADNRTAELARWDDRVLAQTLQEINRSEDINAIVTGFDEGEIDKLVKRMDPNNFKPEDGDESKQTRLDVRTVVTCPNCDHDFKI